jgi:PKD repeat protein
MENYLQKISLQLFLLLLLLGNAVYAYSAILAMPPPPGNALKLDGINDNVSINNTIGNFGTGDFTIETWVKTTSTSSGTIIAKRNANNNGNFFRLGNESSGNITLEINETNIADYTAITSTVSINDGRWHYVAAIRNSGQLFVYIDGQQAATPVTINGNPNISNTVATTLGQFLNGTTPWNRFNGALDEVRIWNVARTPSEFIPNSFNPISTSSTGLVAYYNFDNGIAGGTNTGLNTLTDLTSNGNNGTLNNFGLTGSNSNWVESYAMVVPIFTSATSITNSGFTVNWSAPTTGTVDNGYRLTVSTSLTFATQIAGSPFSSSGTSQTLTGLNPGTTYFYKVNADKTSVTGTGGYSHLNINTTLNPTISTTGTLNAFTACTGLVSSEQSFSVSGSNLSTDIIITPPSGYEVSITSGSGFASTVTLIQSSGTVVNTTLYIRLTNSASGSPAGNIACTSTGATTQNVAVTGTVTSLPTISSATKLSYNGSDLTCFGQSDGQITVVGSGGTGALEYSNGGAYQVSNVFTGLAPNPYTLIVKDANGCLSTSSIVTINQPTAISGTVSNNGPICANTTLSLGGSISGGTGSLSYSWVGPNAYSSADSATLARTVSANALVAMSGLYTVTATDSNNCTYNPSTNAVVNPIPTASFSGTTSVCKDAPSPQITFTGANGTAPYTFTYNINGGTNTTITTIIGNSVTVAAPTNLSGIFTYNLISVVDSSSTLCFGAATGSVTITIRPKPILSSNAAPVLNTICEGTSTTITCTNATNSLGSPSYSALHSNNFNTTIGSEWSFSALVPSNVPAIQNYNGGKVLGYLGNQQATFSLAGLPSHDIVQVDFDLYIHDTWDGNDLTSGPDVWKMSVNGSNVINTTFSNFAYRTQAYPNNVYANNPAFSSSLSSVLVNACNFGGGATSSKYHISKTVPHSANTLTLVLEALGLEDVCNESWSIDNFEVQYRTQSSNSNIVWTNPAVTSTAITVSPIVNTYFVATLGTCSDSINIIVNPTPRADFNINTVNQCVTNNSYNFTNASTLAGGGAVSYAWTITGAATTSATSTNIVGNSYANYGDFNAMLIATSVIGNCSDNRGIKTKTIKVDPAVVIKSSFPNPICMGLETVLTAYQVLSSGDLSACDVLSTPAGTASYSLLHNNDFNTAIGSNWTFPAVIPANAPTLKPFNGASILGYLGNQQAIYNQIGLTSHNYVQIEFDLYIHDTWDGNDISNGPDIWSMSINGNNILNTTFSNNSYRNQAYPNNISNDNPAFTNSLSSTLVNACNFGGGAPTSKYHISKIVPHNASNLNLVLEALGLENVCNESWSIDNFEVSLGIIAGPVSNAIWNGGAVTGNTTCSVAVTPLTNTTYTSTIGTCISPAYSLVINPAPTPTFTLNNSNCSKTTIFTNTNIEIGATYVWSFGDSSTDYTGNNPPAHLYANGTYTVTLTASFSAGCNAVTTQTINIVDAPVAAIAFVGGVGCGNTIQFSSISTIPVGISPTYLWSFGEIIPTTSNLQNPLKTYSIDGNYTVSLTVTTGFGCSSIASTSVISAAVIGSNQALFSAVVSGDCSNFVTTINSSTGTGNIYAWNFGDGNFSNEIAPTHYYINGGNKTITLSITNGIGCASNAYQVVNISNNSGINGRVDFDFTISPNLSQPLISNKFDFTPTFTNNPTNNPPIYCNGSPTWYFGDNTFSSNTNIYQKIYAAVGSYTIRLVQLTTNTGCFGEASKIITIIPNPPFIHSQNSNIETIQTGYESVSNSTRVLNINKKNAEINMFPNPNKGTFKVKVNNISAANGDLIIVDMIGREIYKLNFAVKSNNDIIEVNGLNIAPGTYHLVLNTNEATIARIPFVIITE